jgi:hypothetical protein
MERKIPQTTKQMLENSKTKQQNSREKNEK